MNQAEQKLVEALRSGRYNQYKGGLKSPREKNSFCCLGVACDISNMGFWTITDNYLTPYGESGGYLTKAVINWLGWQDKKGTTSIETTIETKDDSTHHASLASFNDEGFTFDQIADIIEAGLVLHKGE